MQGRHTRIHVHVVLRHAAHQQTFVCVKDIAPLRRDDLDVGLLRTGHLQPVVAFEQLHLHDMCQHSNES